MKHKLNITSEINISRFVEEIKSDMGMDVELESLEIDSAYRTTVILPSDTTQAQIDQINILADQHNPDVLSLKQQIVKDKSERLDYIFDSNLKMKQLAEKMKLVFQQSRFNKEGIDELYTQLRSAYNTFDRNDQGILSQVVVGILPVGFDFEEPSKELVTQDYKVTFNQACLSFVSMSELLYVPDNNI